MKKVEKKMVVTEEIMDAIRVAYDMGEQALDRGSCCYEDWPEAYDALRKLQPYVYPEGDDFIWDD